MPGSKLNESKTVCAFLLLAVCLQQHYKKIRYTPYGQDPQGPARYKRKLTLVYTVCELSCHGFHMQMVNMHTHHNSGSEIRLVCACFLLVWGGTVKLSYKMWRKTSFPRRHIKRRQDSGLGALNSGSNLTGCQLDAKFYARFFCCIISLHHSSVIYNKATKANLLIRPRIKLQEKQKWISVTFSFSN